jgi:hypothetical protein
MIQDFKMNNKLVNITISIIAFVITILLIVLVLYIIGTKFKDTMTIPETYCEKSGGDWNYYDCNAGFGMQYNCEKIGYWCDYKDGTSKSKEDIEYIFNSTELVLT